MAVSSSTVAPASTSAQSNANQWFDVVINNCDHLDRTFAKSLYNRLCSNELRTFLKEDKLQHRCEFHAQIKHAIGTASAHVAIFSTRYAESYWCLDELLLMLESKAPIIPVFYGVTPAEVRWTQRGKNGNYARALQNHEDNLGYDSKTIENWRNALSHVADISGFELEARNIGEELMVLELVDKVVKRLSEMLKKPDLPVADYPTGLDEKVKDFEDKVMMQQQQSWKPQILAIVGSGGVGKTTLAKHFFNRKKLDYRRSCFLFEVADNAAKNSLNSLQSKLLQSLTGLEKRIYSVDEGKGMLIEPLKSCNVLIILDDVDDMNQVDALVPIQSDLGSGSLILITSRDKNVLRNSRVENSSIYTLKGLNTQYSRELFCSHAFSQAFSLPGFERLVNEFIASCDGLPLSLKALGAHLYGKDKSEWYEDLESLQQILSSISDIQKTFTSSYKSLTREDQQIFLDVTCFFMEQNSDTAISIWNESGWRGRQGLQTLEDKFLVEVDRWNVIHMRDHLGYWGRDVAEKSSPRRLCTTQSVIANLLHQSLIPVRGIKLDLNHYNDEDDVFGAMRLMMRMQIVDFHGPLLEPILGRVELANTELANILWLRWIDCPFSSLPGWVSRKNLRSLDVSRSKLITLWQKEGEPQLPLCLEELRVDGCVQLKRIDGLEQLTSLRLLDVSGCSELEELPSMETLVSLEGLQAEGCMKLKSIRGLEHATKLRYLDVSGCSELEELPNIETLASLEELAVGGCAKVKSIRGLEQATNLRLLSVSGCSELEELPSMETLACLELLNAEGCVKLKKIQGLAQLTKLEALKVSGCSELEELMGVEKLASLKVFIAKRCVKLKSIPGLGQCPKLETLLVSSFLRP